MVTSHRMTLRHGCWLVAVGIVVGIAETAPRAAVEAGSTTADVMPALSLRLTVGSDLSGVSRHALINETESIWREARVRLRWLSGSAVPPPGLALRILVTPRAVASRDDGHRWTVGELLRFEGSGAIAVASITGAERIVDESQGAFRLLDLPAVRQHRLGVVLGRAVAHEIGHYMLQTNTHAPYGLMRASIDAREFADLRAATFRLDHEAQAHLATRALAATSTPADFSYSSQ
jgi:hypothetical protein